MPFHNPSGIRSPPRDPCYLALRKTKNNKHSVSMTSKASKQPCPLHTYLRPFQFENQVIITISLQRFHGACGILLVDKSNKSKAFIYIQTNKREERRGIENPAHVSIDFIPHDRTLYSVVTYLDSAWFPCFWPNKPGKFFQSDETILVNPLRSYFRSSW